MTEEARGREQAEWAEYSQEEDTRRRARREVEDRAKDTMEDTRQDVGPDTRTAKLLARGAEDRETVCVDTLSVLLL